MGENSKLLHKKTATCRLAERISELLRFSQAYCNHVIMELVLEKLRKLLGDLECQNLKSRESKFKPTAEEIMYPTRSKLSKHEMNGGCRLNQCLSFWSNKKEHVAMIVL